MRRRRAEDVAPVEGATHWRQPVSIGPKLERAPAHREERREQTVVGTDEAVTAGLEHEPSTRRADAGIDDRDVDRPRREVRRGRLERKRGFRDVMGTDVVSDVDELHVTRDAEDGTLHLGDVRITQAEVGPEREYQWDRRARWGHHDPQTHH